MKTLLWVAVIAVGLYLAFMLLPPYVNNYQFQDDLTAMARMNTYAQNRTAEDIRNEVLAKAKEYKLPVKPEQIEVERTQVGVNIAVNYNVPVQVPGYTFNLKFSPSAGNKMLTAR